MFDVIKSFIFSNDYILTDSQIQLLTLGSICVSIVLLIVIVQLFYKILHTIF